MEQQSFTILLDRYLAGDLSTEDELILLEMIEQPEHLAFLESRITGDLKLHSHATEGPEEMRRRLQAYLSGQIRQDQKSRRSLRRIPVILRWAAAAVVLVAVCTATYFMLYQRRADKVPAIARTLKPEVRGDITPGSTRARLTLANGTTLILDSLHNGVLASQGNSHVQKLGNGQLSYTPIAGDAARPAGREEMTYNALSTPKGGWYQLTLSDGTKVWLNSVSSLTYPVSFNGAEREVTLEGEAYFEVDHTLPQAKDRPFRVHIKSASQHGDMSVMVLGTRFNINAYSDEDAVNTTLVDGAVKVAKDREETLLRPGQQALMEDQDARLKIAPAHIDAVLAWKNGEFHFDSTDIRPIMRQIARWYDVEIAYAESNLDAILYSGGISRKVNVRQLLELLSIDGRLKFELEGRRILVKRSRG